MTRSKGLTHVSVAIELFRLPLRGAYELSIAGLAHRLSNGLRLSNRKLASLLVTDQKTIQRAISRLKELGIIEDTGNGKHDRCLMLTEGVKSSLGEGVTTSKVRALRPQSEGVTTSISKEVNKVKGELSSLACDESEQPGPSEDEIHAELKEILA